MEARLAELKKRLQRKGKLPYLVFDLVNIRYLTGFKGSNAFVLLSESGTYLISDSRYEEYARSILNPGTSFVLQKDSIVTTLKILARKCGLTRIYVEEHALTFSTYRLLQSKIKAVKIIPGGDEINDMRMVKNDHEVSIIKEAVAIADRCFKHILNIIRPGVSEWDIAVEIEYFYKKNGCTKTSFDSIVASGKGSSMPHYMPSMDKKISSGDAVLIDMGCVFRGYNSDLTRTVFVHSIDAELKKIYKIVKSAQEKSIHAIKSGIHTGTIDAKARDYITKHGYGWAFGHALGHGVGMEVHEFPAVKNGGKVRLKENMVLTVEPGIYLPEKGGVRIEDVVRVTGTGCEIFTNSAKDIIIL